MTIGQALSLLVAIGIVAAICKAICAMADDKINKEFKQ